MRINFMITCLLCVSLFGCLKRGQTEFITVCNDHQEISVNTCDALISAVKRDMDDMKSKGILDQKGELQLKDLIMRLEIMKKQSIAINRYVHVDIVDQELLAELVRLQFAR